MMIPPPNTSKSAKGGDDKCKACGKVKSKHTPREKRDCENFSYHMENKK